MAEPPTGAWSARYEARSLSSRIPRSTVEFKPRSAAPMTVRVLHFAADKPADNRHRMIHSAEAASDDDFPSLMRSAASSSSSTLQRWPVGAGIGSGFAWRLLGIWRFLFACISVTRLPIAGRSARKISPRTSISEFDEGRATRIAARLVGTQLTVWLCAMPRGSHRDASGYVVTAAAVPPPLWGEPRVHTGSDGARAAALPLYGICPPQLALPWCPLDGSATGIDQTLLLTRKVRQRPPGRLRWRRS